MFGFFKFWGACLLHAFTKGWIAVGVVGTVLSVVVPFLRDLDQNAAQNKAFWDTVDRFGVAWACIGIFWVIVFVRILWAPYLAWQEMKKQRDDALAEIERIALLERTRFEEIYRKSVELIAQGYYPLRALLEAGVDDLENNAEVGSPVR